MLMEQSIISQPDFHVPISRVLPGMLLSRNLELNGATLLKFGTRLSADQIERLKELGIESLHVQFSDEDIHFYKHVLVTQDSPPSYDSLIRLARQAFEEMIPHFARPEFCARSKEVAAAVSDTIHHTLDVVFGSKRCFDLLLETHMLQLRCLRHCPAAWVYAICIGAGLGYNKAALLDLSVAGLFYDVGMLKVNQRILAKPGRLTEQEWSQVKKHAFFGRKMLEELSQFSASAPIVAFEHHENYYGGGYPKGKSGDSIHEFSQIVSLADKFAALVTSKDYRERFQPYQAYELLLAQTKSNVSPRIFVAFLKNVLLYPRGSMLRLSSGEIAQPVDFPLHSPTRPLVTVTHTRFGEEIVGLRRTINLAEHPELSIEAFAIGEEGPRTPALLDM